MDNSQTTMPNPLGNQGLVPTSIAGDAVKSSAIQPNGPGEQDGTSASAPPTKRKPGRPKGSGKKSSNVPEASVPITAKIKRPVGRPRKDGFPAGSVSSRRNDRPSKVSKPGAEASTSGNALSAAFTYPGSDYFPYFQAPWQSGYSSNANSASYAPPMASLQNAGSMATQHVPSSIDPALDKDNWAELSRSRPKTFLLVLLDALSTVDPESGAGTTIEESFKSHLVSLAPSPNQVQGVQSIPQLYAMLKTFWLPCSPSYFSLTASVSSARTPSEHRFLYWDPQPLVFNGILCPSCSTPLVNRGRIRSGPIKVYDLEKPFFIIGCDYACESALCIAQGSPEGRRYASTDASILRSLPDKLKAEFPAHLMQEEVDLGIGPDVWNWKAMGVSRALWDMVRACLRVGLGKQATLHVVRSVQSSGEVGEQEEEEEDAGGRGDGAGAENQTHDGQRQFEATSRESPSQPLEATDGRATEAYTNTWKVMGLNPASHPIDLGIDRTMAQSVSAGSMTTNAEAGPSHETYNPTHGTTHAPYPYVPYSYFHQQTPFSTHPPPRAHGTLEARTGPPGNQGTSSDVPTSAVHSTAASATLSTASPTSLPKRPFTAVSTIMEPAQKRTRHCCKCGSQECKGKGGRSFCTNKCQDCGKLDCKGRNSRRPDKKCSEAWS